MPKDRATTETQAEASPVKAPDPVAAARALSAAAERSAALVDDFLRRAGEPGGADSHMGGAFLEMTARMMIDPVKAAGAQMAFWSDYWRIWRDATMRMLGDDDVAPHLAPEKGDRRFKDSAWSENALFDFVKQTYLLAARSIQSAVNDVDGMDPQSAKKVDFYTRQFIDAMAPTNFVATNPEVMRRTLETGGENLIRGIENLLGDIERGRGDLRISMTDESAFELGVDIASTPGSVVFENELMQLIQYAPTADRVRERPVLIIPPWINKYYILDLRPKNSFIRWCVDQGLTTFVISWVNPDAALAAKGFDDYMREGPLAAIDAIERACGARDVDAVGYCLGGTLLATTLAWAAAKGDDRIKSATFFTTMVDFAEAGELSVFIDEEQLQALEKQMTSRGFLDGGHMSKTFNMLRANDLIWSFVVNNYLMGQDPIPFDLLYWNSDSTRMPAAMHSFYLRRMYQENALAQKNSLTIADAPIDLRSITTPSYVLSTKEDHIAPWTSTYAATQLYGGSVSFRLAGSGHIAGVVNPPAAGKYGFWTADETPADPNAWFKAAEHQDGSWWPDWRAWLDRESRSSYSAPRTPGDGDAPVIEPAPGRYVRVRTQDADEA